MEKNSINDRFLEAIQSILQRKTGLSKTLLAESLGVKPAKFSEILNGRMKAGVDMMATMCEKYDISTEWLLLGIGTMIRQLDDEIEQSVQECSSTVQKEEEPCSNAVQSPPELVMQLLQKITEQAEEIGRLKQHAEELAERAEEAEQRAAESAARARNDAAAGVA
jgi:plasmid maintenance system antidote protein VapI